MAKALQTRYFDLVRAGRKTYEGRLRNKIQEWNLDVGQKISFCDAANPERKLECRIVELRIFDTFGEAYELLGDCLLPESNVVDCINTYNKFYHYEGELLDYGKTSKMIRDIGVVAIGLQLL
jgi:ASC-1-like (ASCH) protein